MTIIIGEEPGEYVLGNGETVTRELDEGFYKIYCDDSQSSYQVIKTESNPPQAQMEKPALANKQWADVLKSDPHSNNGRKG